MGGLNAKPELPDELIKKYRVRQKIGSGSFSVVWLCDRISEESKEGAPSQKHYALKLVTASELGEQELKLVKEEIKVMKKIAHSKIVRFEESFETDQHICILMEYLSGGSLYDRIIAKGNFGEPEAARVTKAVAGGLKYLHSLKIVHRDLQLENLLYFDKGHDAIVKITDFSLSKLRNTGNTKLTTICGSPGYVAPEILKNESYDEKVDMWSLGVILYTMLCGFPPFYHERTTALFKQIKKGHFDFADPWWSDVSDHAKELIVGLLKTDPRKRISAGRVLKHAWILQGSPTVRPDKAVINRTLMALRKTMRVLIIVGRFKRALDYVKSLPKEHI